MRRAHSEIVTVHDGADDDVDPDDDQDLVRLRVRAVFCRVLFPQFTVTVSWGLIGLHTAFRSFVGCECDGSF